MDGSCTGPPVGGRGTRGRNSWMRARICDEVDPLEDEAWPGLERRVEPLLGSDEGGGLILGVTQVQGSPDWQCWL